MVLTGYTGSKGFNVNYNGQGSSNMISRLGSQLSFTRKDHSMSQISEVNESIMFGNESKRSSGFSLSAWDDTNDNSFIISSSSTTLNALDPQVHFFFPLLFQGLYFCRPI